MNICRLRTWEVADLRFSAWGQRREHAVGWNSVGVALSGTESLLMGTPLSLEIRV